MGTIWGTLREFKTGGITQRWALNLEHARIGAVGSIVGSVYQRTGSCGSDNCFTSDTSGHADGHAIEGRWGGRFYGNNPGQGQPGYNPSENRPRYVAGTFGASMKDGPAASGYDINLIGAFAAER